MPVAASARLQVSRLAELKANVVAKQHPEAWVLAADTTVVLTATSNGAEEILGKPSDVADAEGMLKRLQGREHFVYSGFVLCRFQAEPKFCRVVRSTVRIKGMSSAEIAAYVATKEPMDKAGGYAAQGIGAMFIEAVQGSYTNVVGLPLAEVHEELVRAGLWQPENLLGNRDC